MSAPKLAEFAEDPTPTFGIKVGKAGILAKEPGKGRRVLLKGQNVHAFYLSKVSYSWANPKDCKDPSIWRHASMDQGQAFAVSKIALALQAAILNPRETAINDTAVLFVPKAERSSIPWDLILNSAPVRFVHLVVLRGGLIGVGTPVGEGKTAAWCSVYPRTLTALPVPAPDKLGDLSETAAHLRTLASAIAQRWETVAHALRDADKRRLSVSPGVTWQGWNDPKAVVEGEARVVQEDGMWRLRFFEDEQEKLPFVQGPYEVLNVVAQMLAIQEEPVTQELLEQLEVPTDAAPLSRLTDDARNPNSPEITKFKELLQEADDHIMDAFGLNVDEKAYVRKRLSTPPFDVLEPRWPWTEVAVRGIQEYQEDRFNQ